MNDHIQVVPRAENVLAYVAGSDCLFYRLLEDAGAKRELTSDIDEGGMRLNRIRGDKRALDDRMGIFLDEQPVLERAGLTLIRVANQILGLGIVFRHEAPLHARGKSRAATSAQARSLNLVDQLLRCYLSHHFFPRTISAARLVDRDFVRVRSIDIAQQNFFHGCEWRPLT